MIDAFIRYQKAADKSALTLWNYVVLTKLIIRSDNAWKTEILDNYRLGTRKPARYLRF